MKTERLRIDGYDEAYRIECGPAVAFVAIHALVAGRAFGGIRIRRYASEEAALADALALSRAMSRKLALAELPGGGAKAVLLAPQRDRAEAVRRLGEFIESLGGRYHCGPDLGFTPEDAAALGDATGHIACCDLSGEAARSVLLAMRAVCDPKVVAIQGLGAVGRPLAEKLRAESVRVIASDLRPVEGFESVPPEAIYDVECDVFAPCAAGGVLTAATIPRLRCRAVCGGANNPLASDDDADRLHARGIAYVPDFIANSGAAIRGVLNAVGRGDEAERRMAAIPGLVRDVLARAERERRSPHHVAVAMADERVRSVRARVSRPPDSVAPQVR